MNEPKRYVLLVDGDGKVRYERADNGAAVFVDDPAYQEMARRAQAFGMLEELRTHLGAVQLFMVMSAEDMEAAIRAAHQAMKEEK